MSKEFKFLIQYTRETKKMYFNPNNGLDTFFGDKDRISLNIDHYKKPEISVPEKIQSFAKRNKIKILDYEKGTVKYKDSKNTYKLSKFIKNKKLLSLFVNDPQRGDYSNTKVVFTRNPIDLIRLSYKRNWNSCLNIYDNIINEYYIPENLYDLLRGLTFAAYLVDEDDVKIKKPHGRLLIYPIKSKETGEILFYPSFPEYGNFPEYIQDQVKEFLKDFNKNIFENFKTQSNKYFFDKDVYLEKFYNDSPIYVFKTTRDFLKFFTTNKICKLPPFNENLTYDNFYFYIDDKITIYILDNSEKIKVNNILEINEIDIGLECIGNLFEFPNNHLNFCNLNINYLGSFKDFPEKIDFLILNKYVVLNKKDKKNLDHFNFKGSLKEVDYFIDVTFTQNTYSLDTEYTNLQDFPIINNYVANSIGEKNLKELKRLKKLKYVSKKIKRKGI